GQARGRRDGVAVDPGMPGSDGARQVLAQDDARQRRARRGAPAGPRGHFESGGGRSEIGTATATGRASVDAAFAQASTRAPEGKATSTRPGAGAPVTTPVPKDGWVTRSPGS